MRVRSRDGLPLERRWLVAEEREPRPDAAGGVVDDAVLAAAWIVKRRVTCRPGGWLGHPRWWLGPTQAAESRPGSAELPRAARRRPEEAQEPSWALAAGLV